MLECGFVVAGMVKSVRSLVSAAKQLHPDVIVVDISQRPFHGIEAIRRLQRTETRAKIIVLAPRADATDARKALQAGASGYVVKNAASSELVAAIQEALKGRAHVPQRVAKQVFPRRRQAA